LKTEIDMMYDKWNVSSHNGQLPGAHSTGHLRQKKFYKQ